MASMQETAGVKATVRIGAPSKLPVSQLPEVDEDIPYVHGHKGGILKLLGGVRPTNNMIVRDNISLSLSPLLMTHS